MGMYIEQSLWKRIWKFLKKKKKKKKRELPDDPAIPLLDIYWKKMKSLAQIDICTSIFRGALFTVSKT